MKPLDKNRLYAKEEREMSNITEIQQAILSLPEFDYLQLRNWFNELDWAKWDRQIEEDSESGKLDFLIVEAFE